MAISLPSVGSTQITAKPRVKSKLPSRRINTGVVVRQLAWANSTRSSYSKPACSSVKIELKASGGAAPVAIDFNGIGRVLSMGGYWTISRQGSRTYLNHPGGEIQNRTFTVRATDGKGTVITKNITVNITPYIKPVNLSSVTFDSRMIIANSTKWAIKVKANYEGGKGQPYYFKCGPRDKVNYENFEFIAEYQGGYKYKAHEKSIYDINKGSSVKLYAKYDGGESNKVTINLPKRIGEYRERFKHDEAAVIVLGRKPTFKGTDIIRLPNDGNLARGQTGCQKDYLTYEKAYVSRKTFMFPGAPMGSYNAKVSSQPRKGQIINLNNHRVKFDWHHLGWGIDYTAVIEAQRRTGICSYFAR